MSERPKNLLPYIEWDNFIGLAQRLYADVMPGVTIDLDADVTEHPVESGGVVVDNYRTLPEVVTMELFFSNTPTRGDLVTPGARAQTKRLEYPPGPGGASLLTPGGLTAAASAGVASALGMGESLPKSYQATIAFDFPSNRSVQAFEIIQELRADATLVRARTTLGILDQLLIKNAKFSRTHESGDGTYLALELRRVRFATSEETVALPIPEEPRGNLKNGNIGAQGTEAISGAAGNESILSTMAGAF